jgi:uncharacterized membrane protein YfcA
MNMLSGFANISLWQLALVAGVASLASLVGGVSGYGTGALMPLVLVPLVGPEPVVPIIAISALFNNASRLTAFRSYADFRRAGIVLTFAVPTCVLGAWGSGVILLSLLMAAGVQGAGVIATDAAVSIVIGVVKTSVFGLAGVLTAQVVAFALLIGIVALPGAFLAKAFVERLPVHVHTAILDAVVLLGGIVMVAAALR